MLTVQRVIYDTTDISTVVNDYRSTGYALAYTTGKYLYIGSELPFMRLWWEVKTANTVAAVPTVEIWWGQSWNAAVDLIDQTVDATGAKTLNVAGPLQYSTDIMKGWQKAQISSWIPSFPNANIYHFYWTRWSWNANITPTIKYVGQKFSVDRDLFAYYPDLNNPALMTAYGAAYDPTKSDWSEQAFMAAEQIARDLIGRKIIWARGQIVDWNRLTEASVHKTAELIYRGLGQGTADIRVEASRLYERCMKWDFFRVDADADGHLEPQDRFFSSSYMSR